MNWDLRGESGHRSRAGRDTETFCLFRLEPNVLSHPAKPNPSRATVGILHILVNEIENNNNNHFFVPTCDFCFHLELEHGTGSKEKCPMAALPSVDIYASAVALIVNGLLIDVEK